MPELEANRRPIASRSAGWAKAAAAFLARTRVTPNQISVVSVVFAAIGAAMLALKPDAIGLLGCAIAVQARLICNLLDGMVAIEGGKKSPVGSIFNEFPDRIADSLFIVALGYAVGWPALGWFGALAAALTAYIRVFGGSLGFAQDFRGPMAKQQRMAILTAGCVIGAAEWLFTGTHYVLIAVAVIIAAGSVVTCITRTLAIAARLKES
jgi:phosphatidylglycerophosphate synthase